MRRRDVIAGAMALAAWPGAAFAQGSSRPRRVGFLGNSSEGDTEGTRRLEIFRQRLRELGWIEGRTLALATRFGDNNVERIRQAATELGGLAVDAIVSTTSTTTRALLDTGTNIPVVAAVSGDPIALGFTKDLSRPTGNVTGFTTLNDTLAAKRLAMLHEIVPGMRAAALIWVPINPVLVLLESQTREAAKAQGVELVSLPIKSSADLAPALASARDQKVAALIVAPDPLTTGSDSRAIIDQCIAMKLPAMHTFPFEARSGALVTYGIDVLENFRRTADYVDQILKGTKVADMPFQEPTRFTLAINLKTARAIDVRIPPTLLASADEVIE